MSNTDAPQAAAAAAAADEPNDNPQMGDETTTHLQLWERSVSPIHNPIYPHVLAHADCGHCASGYPRRCRCGGLIHAGFAPDAPVPEGVFVEKRVPLYCDGFLQGHERMTHKQIEERV